MKKKSVKGKKTGGELVLDVFKVFFVLLVSVVCVYPFWNIFIISVNDGQDALRGGLYFWPRVLHWKITRKFSEEANLSALLESRF